MKISFFVPKNEVEEFNTLPLVEKVVCAHYNHYAVNGEAEGDIFALQEGPFYEDIKDLFDTVVVSANMKISDWQNLQCQLAHNDEVHKIAEKLGGFEGLMYEINFSIQVG